MTDFDINTVRLVEKPIKDEVAEFMRHFNAQPEKPAWLMKLKNLWWVLKYKIKYRGKELVMKDEGQ